MKILVSWLCLTLLAASMSYSAEAGKGFAHVYVVLEDEGTAAFALRAGAMDPTARRSVLAAKAKAIEARQNELERELKQLGATPRGRFGKLVNALRLRVPVNQLERIRQLPGAKRIVPVTEFWRQTASSVPFIGAPQVWSGRGTPVADGTGIRIGIIDSGIDYLHADFGGSGDPAEFANNDPRTIEPGTFPTAKVVGGYDFAGEDYGGTGTMPEPDPDPLDIGKDGHGTHVAGIAGGLGVLTNGLTFTGDYTQDLNPAQFGVGPGVAPGALLYALKVFGREGPTDLLVEALEWAADPNRDGDFNDRLDVVNLSVGSAFGFTGAGDLEHEVVNRLGALGCIVVAGAGNNGNVLYNIFSPASAERCIAVGGSIDAGYNPALEVISPPEAAGLYEAVEGLITRPLSAAGVLEAPVVYVDPPLACEPPLNATEISGRIVLMDRGTCTFVDKIRRVESLGALAVIVVNNVPGSPVPMGGTALNIGIPGFMISQTDGDLLKELLSAALVVRLDPAAVYPRSLADQLYAASSRGPVSPATLLKPELVAPGENIISAAAGTGTGGKSESGTSMATPHVAGAAAILRQVHPTWTVEEIKAALMNTARPTRDGNLVPYPESWTGAGRVQVEQAARTPVTIKPAKADGLVGLSFGSLVLTNRYTETRDVLLTNHGAVPITFDIAVTNTVSEPGFVLAPLSNSVTVPALGSAIVPVQLTADPRLFDRTADLVSPPLINGLPRNSLFEASGRILFFESNLTLALPFYCALRAGSQWHVQATAATIPNSNDIAIVTLPQHGTSAHPAALVSVFQLGATNAPQHATDPTRALGDVLAFGAASDFPRQGDLQQTTVYFGIAVAGDWTTPQPFVVRLEVQVDRNGDGIEEFRISNSSQGNHGANSNNLYIANNANDAFLSVLEFRLNNTSITNGYLNVFPATRDTAPFNNSVLVLPVPARALGLTSDSSAFRYRVRTSGPLQRSSPVLDTTDYVLFDAAHPVIDTTSYGVDYSPFHTDGAPVKLRVDRNAGLALNATPKVLLLHHFNIAGDRVEVVPLLWEEIRLTWAAMEFGQVRLGFRSAAQRRYRLEVSPRLDPANWTTAIEEIAGTGGMIEVWDPDPGDEGTRFYRVQLLP